MDKKVHYYKNPLSRSMTRWCAVFAVVLAFVIGILGFFIYLQDIVARYQKTAIDTLNFVVQKIDVKDLEECIRTKNKSEKYFELQNLMDNVKEIYRPEFIYIVVPLKAEPPDNIMDVVSGCTKEGLRTGEEFPTQLGYLTGDAYTAAIAENYLRRMDKSSKVSFFRNETGDFGDVYTAIRPILNHDGDPIAVICLDITVKEIEVSLKKFFYMTIFAAAIASLALIFIMSNLINKRVVAPIVRLENSAKSFADKCHRRTTEFNLKSLVFDDPKINTGDEIESLSHAMNSMCSDMRTYALDLFETGRQLNSMKAQVSKMDILAYRDSLTGAGNKAAYEKMKERIDLNISSDTETQLFAIVMADLNYLKRINDTYGHDNGNFYIKRMYEMLSFRFENSPIFRIGGDEFVVIVEEEFVDDISDLIVDIKIETEEMATNEFLKPWEKVSVALGVAIYDQWLDGCVDDVFRRADAAMYEDKRAMRAGRE